MHVPARGDGTQAALLGWPRVFCTGSHGRAWVFDWNDMFQREYLLS